MSAKKAGMTIATIFTASDMMSKPLSGITHAANMASKALATIGVGFGVGSMVDFTREAISSTIDYEKTLTGAMAKISPLLDSTSKEWQQMDNLAKQIGIDTEFTASQAAAGIKELAAAGWETNQIMQGLPGIIDVATAAQVDFASATSMVNSALNIYGLSADKASYVGDVMMQAGNISAASMEYMSGALIRSGNAASSLNIPFEELNASIAMLSNSGLTAEVAGTGLATIFTRITKQPKEFTKAITQAGIKLQDAQGNFIGMTAVLEQISVASSGMTDMEKGAFFAQLSGGGAGANATLQVLAKNVDGLKAFNTELLNAEGASGMVARRMRGTTAGFIAAFNSVKESLQLALGTAFLPALVEILGRLTESMKPLVPYFTLFGNVLGTVVVGVFNFTTAMLPVVSNLLPLFISLLTISNLITLNKIRLDTIAWGSSIIANITQYFTNMIAYLTALNPMLANYGKITQIATVLSHNFSRATATLGGKLSAIILVVGVVVTVFNFLSQQFGIMPTVITMVVVALGALAIALKIVGIANPFGVFLTILSVVVTIITAIIKKFEVLQKIGSWIKKVFGGDDQKKSKPRGSASPATMIDEHGQMIADLDSVATLGADTDLVNSKNPSLESYDTISDYSTIGGAVSSSYTINIKIDNNNDSNITVDTDGVRPPNFTMNQGRAS